MRTRDRILTLTALGLVAGLTPAFAFEGAVRPPADVPAAAAAAPAPAISRAARPDVPRPPGSIPSAGAIMPVVVPNATLPRPSGPVPALAAPAAPIGRPLPPPTAFAAPATPITPFEALRSGTRALKEGDTSKARVSLEYAAEQGLVGAQWKLGRMYAEGEGVDQSDIRAFEYFSRIANGHADDNPGTPQARFVASAFVALGHYYRDGIPDTEVKRDLDRAQRMYGYAASYFRDPDAQYHLARLMLDGNGPLRDARQAAMWLNSAANKGQHQAQAVLGRLLFKGEPGIQRQPARGLMWLTLARSNAAPGETWIAELHESAFKQATEEERAVAGDYLMRWMNMNAKRDPQ
jgi:uncharacterized protein